MLVFISAAQEVQNVLVSSDPFANEFPLALATFLFLLRKPKDRKLSHPVIPSRKKKMQTGQPSHPELHRIDSCLAHTLTFVLVSAAVDEDQKTNFKLNSNPIGIIYFCN